VIPFNKGRCSSRLQETADSRIKIQSTDIHCGKHSLPSLQHQSRIYHSGSCFLGKTRFQKLLQKLHHDLTFSAGVHAGTHSIRKTHHKLSAFFLSADIVVPGNLFFLSCKLCHSVHHLIADVFHKMYRMVFAVYNASAVSGRGHSALAQT